MKNRIIRKKTIKESERVSVYLSKIETKGTGNKKTWIAYQDQWVNFSVDRGKAETMRKYHTDKGAMWHWEDKAKSKLYLDYFTPMMDVSVSVKATKSSKKEGASCEIERVLPKKSVVVKSKRKVRKIRKQEVTV